VSKGTKGNILDIIWFVGDRQSLPRVPSCEYDFLTCRIPNVKIHGGYCYCVIQKTAA